MDERRDADEGDMDGEPSLTSNVCLIVDHQSPLELALTELCHGSTPERLRRGSPRLTLARPVRFRPVDAKKSTIGALRNISAGGAFIHAPVVPEPGTLLAFGFYLFHHGERHLLRSMAKVVWTAADQSQPPGFGLRLVRPSDELVAIIERLTAEHRQRER